MSVLTFYLSREDIVIVTVQVFVMCALRYIYFRHIVPFILKSEYRLFR